MHHLTINPATTSAVITDTVAFIDMREHAIECLDDAVAANLPKDETLLELHSFGDIVVLYSPTWDYALVNEHGPGIGNSLLIEFGGVSSAEAAAETWREINWPINDHA